MDAVLFDIGGVIINDHKLRERARDSLGITDHEAFWKAFNEAALPACRGEEPLSNAWKRVGQMLNITVPDSLANSLWNDDYQENITVNHDLLALVDQLRTQVKTGVISNTLDEHATILRRMGIYDHFDHVILSHEVGITKDSPVIFDIALEQLKLLPAQVAFIDDVERFRAVAQEKGMHAILYQDNDQLKAKLREIGLTVE